MLIIFRNTLKTSTSAPYATNFTTMFDTRRITWVAFSEPDLDGNRDAKICLVLEHDEPWEAKGDLARDLKALLIENCHPSNLGTVHVRNSDGAMGGQTSVDLGQYVDGMREVANVESAAAEPEATAEPWAVYILSHALGVSAIAAKLRNDYTDGRVLWYQCHGPRARVNAESEASRINNDPVVLEKFRRSAGL